jgi:hypothetical protein
MDDGSSTQRLGPNNSGGHRRPFWLPEDSCESLPKRAAGTLITDGLFVPTQHFEYIGVAQHRGAWAIRIFLYQVDTIEDPREF